MGWGDVLGALGATAQGVNRAYREEQDSRDKEKLAKQQEELRMMLMSMQTGSKERIAQGANETKLQLQADKDNAAYKLRQLVNAGNVDVKRLSNEGMAYVRELENQGILDREDRRGITLLNLKNIDKEIQAAHDTAGVERANIGADASKYGADTRSEAQHYTVDTEEAGRNKRWEGDEKLREYNTQMRYQYPRSTVGRRGSPGAPSFQDWRSQTAAQGLPPSPFGPSPTAAAAGAAAAPSGLPPAPPPPSMGGAPPLPGAAMDPMAADALQRGFQAPMPPRGAPAGEQLFQEPGSTQAPMFGPSQAMPPMGGPPPSMSTVTNPAFGPSSSQVRDMWSPMLSGVEGRGGAPPAAASPVAAPPAAAAAPPAAAAAAAPPVSDNKRKMDAAADLMRRITTAEGSGDFKTGRALRQLLGDMLR